MTEPFSPGGIIPSRDPESDLVLAPLSPSGAILRMRAVRDLSISGSGLEDWLVRREKEGGDDHQG